jgi:hypothetical protein
MSEIDKWAKDDGGNIQVCPVLGWSTAIFAQGMSGGLRIEYSTEPTLRTRSAIQFISNATTGSRVDSSARKHASTHGKTIGNQEQSQ